MATLSSPVDERGALRHVLDIAPAPSSQPEPEDHRDYAEPSTEQHAHAHTHTHAHMKTELSQEDEAGSGLETPRQQSPSVSGEHETPTAGDGTPNYTANATTLRRNANGSVSSVYSGNKIRHLKKDDGHPLWRKDIQYDFLKTVFEDDKPVFHKQSDGSMGNTFADIYLDAMAKSSKCSKILKDKLLSDRPAGVNMAMVCLLVNVGRMNTTLNFFPEMRAQLRTYHSIPSLQAHQDANAYKQLQDAPRLKSILKGATEDIEQPGTIEDIKAAEKPRTNPVNLIFVLTQQAPKISEMHFDVPRDFFDLVMKEQLSSASRARAFLWLMWWYLESDFSLEAALSNPFGPGRRNRDAPNEELPIKCPQFDFLTDEEALLENVDTPDELEFGETKRVERLAIINGDVTPLLSGPKRFNVQKSKMYPQNPVFAVNSSVMSDDALPKEVASPGMQSGKNVFRNKTIHNVAPKNDYTSDSDHTRPTSPVSQSRPSKSRARALHKEETPVRSSSKGSAKVPSRRTRPDGTIEIVSLPRATPKGAKQDSITTVFVPVNGGDPAANSKRARPLTSHQIAVENFRKQRVSHIVSHGLRKIKARADRRRARQNAVVRAWTRIRALETGYDSDEEAYVFGAGRPIAAQLGVPLAGFGSDPNAPDDYGAEAARIAYMFGRFCRRDDARAAQAWHEAYTARKRPAPAPAADDDTRYESRSDHHSSDSEAETARPKPKKSKTVATPTHSSRVNITRPDAAHLMPAHKQHTAPPTNGQSPAPDHEPMDTDGTDNPHAIPQFRPHPPLHHARPQSQPQTQTQTQTRSPALVHAQAQQAARHAPSSVLGAGTEDEEDDSDG